MVVKGSLPPVMYGGAIRIIGAGVGPPLMGSVPTVACIMVVLPLAGMPVIMGGKDMGPLPLTTPKKGSIFMPAMGLEGVVKKLGSDW